MATGVVAAQTPKGVSFALPQIPQPTGVSPADASRAPNALSREYAQQTLAALPGKYLPQALKLKGDTKQALAGFGGWTFTDDDSETVEREDLNVPTKTSTRLGTLEREAVLAERAKAAAAGVLYSSYANRAVGTALGQLNEQAKGIVRQYASGIGQLVSNMQTEATDIVRDIVGWYGEDARWLAENPPPVAPQPEPQTQPDASNGGTSGNTEGTTTREQPKKTKDGYWLWKDGRITADLDATILIKRPPNTGKPITWSFTNPKKPPYTPAQIQHRFGKGAQLTTTFVNGKKVWVVKLPGGGIARG